MSTDFPVGTTGHREQVRVIGQQVMAPGLDARRREADLGPSVPPKRASSHAHHSIALCTDRGGPAHAHHGVHDHDGHAEAVHAHVHEFNATRDSGGIRVQMYVISRPITIVAVQTQCFVAVP
jgi:hypothetical protein